MRQERRIESEQLEREKLERQIEREQMEREGEERNATLQQVQEQLSELSRFNNRESRIDENLVRSSETVNSATESAEYKIRPDTYDGTGSLKEFLAQFELIAEMNEWPEKIKTRYISCKFKRKSAFNFGKYFENH